MNENLQNQNFKHEFFAQQNRPKRDYDKEPIIIRDYSGFPFILHHLGILIFWIVASSFSISFLDDFESGNLDINQTKQMLIIFGLIVIAFLAFDCFNIIKSKKKYICYYTSKVVYCDEKFKETSTHTLYEKGKFIKAIWFLDTVFTTIFGRVFLVMFLMLSFFEGTFGVSLAGVFVLFFILFIAEILEILVFMAIYKYSNKSFKNFWKYFPKFQLNIEYLKEVHWSDNRCDERLYSIHLFLFKEEDYGNARDYILSVFEIDIDKNLKNQQQFKNFF